MRKTTRFLPVLIFLIGFLVYINLLGNGFVWDDEEQVLNNPYIQNFKYLPQIFKGSTFTTGGAGLSGWYYKPLMSLWFMVNWQIFGKNAWGFHLTQLFLHLTNGILIFYLFKKLFSGSEKKRAEIIAFFSALIFVIHPANCESVAYISASQEIIYTFFLLISLLTLFSPNDSLANLGASAGFFLGLLAKESAIIGLLILPLFYGKIRRDFKKGVRLLLGLIFFLWGWFILRTFFARIPLSSPKIAPIGLASTKERFLTMPYELFSYLRLIIFPVKLAIAQHQVVRSITDIRFWVGLATVASFLVLILLKLKKMNQQLAWFFFFWFVFSLAIVLNIFPLDMSIAERWLYFPLIGFLGMVGVIVLEEKRKIPSWALVGILVLLSLRTFSRTFDWRNGLTLFSQDIKVNPEAFDLQNNLGTELFRAGRIEEAAPHFEKSIELAPYWWTNYSNLGVVFERRQEPEKAKQYYQRAIENGNYYLAYENLAFLILKTETLQKAIDFANKALEKLPGNSNLRTVLVAGYSRAGDFQKAQTEAEKLFLLNPTPKNQLILETIKRKEKI